MNEALSQFRNPYSLQAKIVDCYHYTQNKEYIMAYVPSAMKNDNPILYANINIDVKESVIKIFSSGKKDEVSLSSPNCFEEMYNIVWSYFYERRF